MQPMLAETMACGSQRRQMASLRSRSCVGQLGLQHRVGAGRAAAQVAFVGASSTSKPSALRCVSTPPRSCWPCCKRARRMERERQPALRPALRPRAAARLQLGRHQFGQQLAQVARQRADACGLVGIVRVVRQRMAVVLDGDAAARGVHHDRLDLPATSDPRPAATRRRCCGACRPGRLRGRSGACGSRRSSRRRRPPGSGCRRRRARARWRC